jgi:hypothetical protein
MRRRIAIALVCALLACSKEDSSGTRETYDYVVTPAGQRFRVIGAGPILRGANTRIGMRITYVAQALTKAELLAHADALVAALGPELQLFGDKTLTVRARIGVASVALDSENAKFDLEYRLGPSGFQRADAGTSPPALADTNVLDDPTFPFQAEQLTAAALISSRWIAHLDEDDMDAIRPQVAPGFREQIMDDGQLAALLARRYAAGLPGTRRELYRMQQRITDKPRPPGADALIVYECRSPRRPRVLERLELARDADAWKITSYAFQPLPP